MKKQIPTTREEMYCDICGKQTDTSYGWSFYLSKDGERYIEGGNGYTHTGDWCEDCRDNMVSIISGKLDEAGLIERYDIDHSGKNGTIEHYKKILS